MTSSVDKLKEEAERDESGDLIHTREIKHKRGHTTKEVTNLSALLNPGKRTTGDINILLHEARQAEQKGVDNPAWPADADTANEAVTNIVNEGLEPAWKDSEPPRYI